jgi:hypothetical protein
VSRPKKGERKILKKMVDARNAKNRGYWSGESPLIEEESLNRERIVKKAVIQKRKLKKDREL